MRDLLVGLRIRIEFERGRVDAVAQARRLGTVVEDVALVRTTNGAVHLRTPHKKEAPVLLGFDVAFVDRRPEARPTRTGVVLGLGAKELRAAAGAAVDAFLLLVPVLAVTIRAQTTPKTRTTYDELETAVAIPVGIPELV